MTYQKFHVFKFFTRSYSQKAFKILHIQLALQEAYPSTDLRSEKSMSRQKLEAQNEQTVNSDQCYAREDSPSTTYKKLCISKFSAVTRSSCPKASKIFLTPLAIYKKLNQILILGRRSQFHAIN